MRMYKTSPFGDEVDLDNPATYEHLPKTIRGLRQKMFEEIGYTYCYMNFWHPDLFGPDNEQRKRIESLVKEFTENEREHYKDEQWYREQIFMFEDENENMC